MGYDLSWSHFHVVECMSHPYFAHKRAAYLTASLLFTAQTEVNVLTTHLFRKVCVCVCVCVYVCVRVCVFVCICVYLCMCVYLMDAATYQFTCSIHTRTYTHIRTCTHTHTHTHTYTYTHHIHTHTHTHITSHTHTHTHTQAFSQSVSSARLLTEGMFYETGAAINCLSNICTETIANNLLPEIYGMMNRYV